MNLIQVLWQGWRSGPSTPSPEATALPPFAQIISLQFFYSATIWNSLLSLTHSHTHINIKKGRERCVRKACKGGGWGSKALSARLTCELDAGVCKHHGQLTVRGPRGSSPGDGRGGPAPMCAALMSIDRTWASRARVGWAYVSSYVSTKFLDGIAFQLRDTSVAVVSCWQTINLFNRVHALVLAATWFDNWMVGQNSWHEGTPTCTVVVNMVLSQTLPCKPYHTYYNSLWLSSHAQEIMFTACNILQQHHV